MIFDNTQNNQIGPVILNGLINSDHIDIATAFFTNVNFLDQVIDPEVKDCSVRLIVRLNDATDPNGLLDFINNEKIDMRYFTDQTFHPKCYILKNEGVSQVAYIGSANLTINGMQNNQEIMASIEDESDLNHLNELFESYWNESEVITYDILQKAIEFKNGHNEPNDNGGWGNGLPFGNNNELQRYQRDYQDYSTKFNRIRTMYTDMGERKFQDDIPIRIEIDGFLSSVYTLHQLNQDNDNGEPNFDGDFKLWINLENDYVDNFVERYNRIINGFSNENIGEHNNESLQQLLLTMHAPNTALNRYPGGFDRFIEDNQGLHTIIDRLSYLLGYCDDNDSQILRMHNLISNDEYRLNRFNISSVQELVGWCNDEDLPIINERSRRTLDYYL